jgi:WD40 repeat protein
VAFDPSGRQVATGSTDQTARLWRTRSGDLVTPLFGHTGQITGVAFGPNGLVVTASRDGTARTWVATGRPVQTLRGHSGEVVAAAFAGPDTVVTAGADGTVRIWDPGTTIELARARVNGPSAPARRVTAAGGAEAVIDKSVVRLHTAAGNDLVLRGHGDLVNSVSFSPDGRLLVTAGRDHDVLVWDAGTGSIVRRFPEAHSASVPDARFSPDGRWIVTAGPRSARIWNVSDGRPLPFYLYGPKPPVTAVAFGPDSRTVVTREKSGIVRRYVCELCGGLDELSALARSRLRATGRELTPEEREFHLG